jgi:hypothetical protein
MVVAAGSLVVLFLLSEWWPIAVARDAAFVAEYPFASEHAMADGGWNYANPELYAWMTFLTAIFAGVGTTLLSLAIFRRSRRLLVAFLILLASYQVASTLMSQHDWERRREMRS